MISSSTPGLAWSGIIDAQEIVNMSLRTTDVALSMLYGALCSDAFALRLISTISGA
jgi:hypothetical protein